MNTLFLIMSALASFATGQLAGVSPAPATEPVSSPAPASSAPDLCVVVATEADCTTFASWGCAWNGTGCTKGGAPSAPAGSGAKMCCAAMTSTCEACRLGTTEADYCKKNPKTQGCTALAGGGQAPAVPAGSGAVGTPSPAATPSPLVTPSPVATPSPLVTGGTPSSGTPSSSSGATPSSGSTQSSDTGGTPSTHSGTTALPTTLPTPAPTSECRLIGKKRNCNKKGADEDDCMVIETGWLGDWHCDENICPTFVDRKECGDEDGCQWNKRKNKCMRDNEVWTVLEVLLLILSILFLITSCAYCVSSFKDIYDLHN